MENTILFTLGSASVTIYSLFCTVALLSVLTVMALYALKHGASAEHILGCAVPGVGLGWLFSRLVYFTATWFFSPVNPYPSFRCILNVGEGGFSMLGMGLGLTLGVWLGSRLSKAPRGLMTDALALALPVGLVIARVAESFTTLGVGLDVDDGWTRFGILVDANGYTMHAIWAYEAIVAAILFAVMLALTCTGRLHRGEALPVLALLFSATQVVLESLRDDSHMTAHMQIHSQQIICAVILAVPLALWAARAMKAHSLKLPVSLALIVLALACVGVAIVAEFGVDRWDSKLLAYGLMTGSLAIYCGICFCFKHFARR